MKIKIQAIYLIMIIGFLVLLVSLIGIIFLATPRYMAMNSLQFKKIAIEGSPFVRFDGTPMNYLGQFQMLSVERDDSKREITVKCLIILKNPFTKTSVGDGWPLFCPLEGAPLGKYTIVLESEKGKTVVGSLDN